MPINNSDCIKKFATGVVYEVRVPIQEDFSIDNTGKRTITSDRTFITTQTATKVDVASTDAYAEVVAPFQIEDYPFYATSISLKRVDHVAGTRTSREVGGSGMAPVARWVCTVVFETRTNVSQERTEDSQKKTDEYPVITWSSNRFDMATTTDIFGKPYRNTAGDFFAGISRPAEERVYSVSVNVPVRDPNNPSVDLVDVMTTNANGDRVPKSARAIATELQVIEAGGLAFEPYYTNLYNYTNNSEVRIRGQVWPINTLRVGSMQVGEIQIDNSELYFQVQYTLLGRPWGWHREVANRGMNELEWTIPAGVFADRSGLTNLGFMTGGLTAAQQKVYTERRSKPYVFNPNQTGAAEVSVWFDVSYTSMTNRLTTKGGFQVVTPAGLETQEDKLSWALMNYIAQPRRVPVVDAKGKLLPQPVFLDGFGQAQGTDGAAPGELGDITVFSANPVGTCSFNPFEYLGSKLSIRGLNTPLFIPATPAAFGEAMRQVNIADSVINATLQSRVTNLLPLCLSEGTVVTERQGTVITPKKNQGGFTLWKPNASDQSVVDISPGITMTFQDYFGADLSALPGVYLV